MDLAKGPMAAVSVSDSKGMSRMNLIQVTCAGIQERGLLRFMQASQHELSPLSNFSSGQML